MLAQKYKAPFIPNLHSDIDTNNFDAEFTRCSIESEEEREEMEELEEGYSKFKDFSFGE